MERLLIPRDGEKIPADLYYLVDGKKAALIAAADPSISIKLFTHVDPAHKRFSAKEFLTVHLPSMLKFYYLIYDLLNQQR